MDKLIWPPKVPTTVKNDSIKAGIELIKANPIKSPWYRWLYFKHTTLSTKQWLLLGSGALVLLLVTGFGAYYLRHRLTRVTTSVAYIKPKPVLKKPTIVTSNLTGLPIDPSLKSHPVTAVMIENSPDARPQSGLLNAGIVYEAIAEGGITRFMALYQAEQPDYIGPIRSVRPYYLDFLMPFDAAVAHVGGAPQALSDIKTLGVKDLDQFYSGSSYTRITSRYAPHNVYTSMAELNKLETTKGYTTSTYSAFPRKKEAPAKTPTAQSIDFPISGYLYSVHYDYDAKTNAYKRSEGGQPHIDERSGTQLEPKVVIALEMSRGIDGDGEHTDYGTVGSGAMYVFQDGLVTGGTWHKATRQAQFSFADGSGAAIKLNPGQTWITIVDPGTVAYKP